MNCLRRQASPDGWTRPPRAVRAVVSQPVNHLACGEICEKSAAEHPHDLQVGRTVRIRQIARRWSCCRVRLARNRDHGGAPGDLTAVRPRGYGQPLRCTYRRQRTTGHSFPRNRILRIRPEMFCLSPQWVLYSGEPLTYSCCRIQSSCSARRCRTRSWTPRMWTSQHAEVASRPTGVIPRLAPPQDRNPGPNCQKIPHQRSGVAKAAPCLRQHVDMACPEALAIHQQQRGHADPAGSSERT